LVKLEKIRDQLKNREEKRAVFSTMGHSMSILGSVLSVSSVLLVPFTSGASLVACGASGIFTTVCGQTIHHSTSISGGIWNRKTIQELNCLLKTRLEKHGEILKLSREVFNKILDAKKHTPGGKLLTHLYSNRELYGLNNLTLESFKQPKQLGEILDSGLKQGLTTIGSDFSQKYLFAGLGAFSIYKDFRSIVRIWNSNPEQCPIDELIDALQSQLSEAFDFAYALK